MVFSCELYEDFLYNFVIEQFNMNASVSFFINKRRQFFFSRTIFLKHTAYVAKLKVLNQIKH